MGMQHAQMSQRQVAESRYKSARWDLLIVVIFTVLNIAGMLGGSESMMLFSATVPYYAVVVGYYAELQGAAGFLTISLVFAGVILTAYLLCWIFSKKRYSWMTAALVLFCVDTLMTVLLYSDALGEGIMDFVIHGIVIWYLVMGVKAGKQLKNMPQEVVDAEGAAVNEQLPPENTAPIRRADTEVKSRTLAEAETVAGKVCYRRVKRVNELVINGYVYDEVEMLVETGHELRAVYNGHLVQVGLATGSSVSYIMVDGQQVAKKIRWI